MRSALTTAAQPQKTTGDTQADPLVKTKCLDPELTSCLPRVLTGQLCLTLNNLIDKRFKLGVTSHRLLTRGQRSSGLVDFALFWTVHLQYSLCVAVVHLLATSNLSV